MRLDFISGLQLYLLALNQTCCLKSANTLWIWPFPLSIIWCIRAKSLQSCWTLCDPMGCNLPGSSVHGILQARILEWVVMPSSRDLPNSGIKPMSPEFPGLADRFFTTSTTWEVTLVYLYWVYQIYISKIWSFTKTNCSSEGCFSAFFLL